MTVFEKSDRIGGLLRYGIPEFKMEKRFLDRRLAVLEEEGVIFRAGVNVGVDVPMSACAADFDAILLAGGAGQPRDLPVPGRELKGIHFAMDYLTLQNRRNEGDVVPDAEFITAKDKHVIIIGGGDTGADCLGTAHRQGALVGAPARADADAARRARGRQPVAAVAADLPRLRGARGRRRAALLGLDAALQRRRGRTRQALHAVQVEMVKKDGRVQFAAGAGHRSSSCRPISCCWRWASSVPRRARCSTISA